MEKIASILADLRVIEDNPALFAETNFVSRAEAIDFIEFHILDRIEGMLLQGQCKEELEVLSQRAARVKCMLEKIDAGLFDQLREKIRTGISTTSSFLEMIGRYAGHIVHDTGLPVKAGYDHLDVFINGLLCTQPIPETTNQRAPEMVFFQKTPVRVIFELTRLAGLTPDDVFFDIGSGLGQAAILVNLINGATAVGIDYEPVYCDYARACATRLNLAGSVQFINLDARMVDYSRGTVFFLYTPFEGGVLQEMLGILKKEAMTRAIRIYTYGPCSSQVARPYWLTCINGTPDNPDQLCEFRNLTASIV